MRGRGTRRLVARRGHIHVRLGLAGSRFLPVRRATVVRVRRSSQLVKEPATSSFDFSVVVAAAVAPHLFALFRSRVIRFRSARFDLVDTGRGDAPA